MRYLLNSLALFLFIFLYGFAVFLFLKPQDSAVVFQQMTNTSASVINTRTLQKAHPQVNQTINYYSLPSLKAGTKLNFLFLGYAGRPNPAPFLTDTIIFASLKADNPPKAAIVSIPRDLLVQDKKGTLRKINSLFLKGRLDNPQNPQEEVVQKVAEITGQKIDYFAILDLESVKKIIDILGGVDVLVPQDIYDPAFPGRNYSYQTFNIKKGLHHLSGEEAIKYIRTRHTRWGDFDRTARQRQIIQDLGAKMIALSPLWNFGKFLSIYKSLKGHITTNLDLGKMRQLYSLIKDFKGKNLVSSSLDPLHTRLLKVEKIPLGKKLAYALVPTEGLGKYDKIHSFFANLFSTLDN